MKYLDSNICRLPAGMEIRPMKKYLLSNRVRNAILLAILLQSVIFGIGLLVTGTFFRDGQPSI